jgi:hypothetical protein
VNTTSCNAEAAAALTSKAARLDTAAAAGKKGADEKRRLAAALRRIAALAAEGADAVLDGLRNADMADVTDDDRRAAAAEIYSLATRRQSRGIARSLDAPLKRGSEPGADDFALPIHRATLREAAELYDLANAVHAEEYWVYLKGLLLEQLGDYAAAVRTFDSLTGYYAVPGAQQAERSRRKLAGGYDPQAAVDASFDELIAQFDRRGVDAGPVRDLKEMLLDTLAAGPSTAAATSDDDDDGEDALDLAAFTAQQFAEHLVDGDFQAAQAMLARDLAAITADILQRDYKGMIEYADVADGASIEVCVMSAEDDMPDMTPADLGWVYVAISCESFSEAVTVVVTREGGGAKIRDLEWGRP